MVMVVIKVVRMATVAIMVVVRNLVCMARRKY
jgi:hypothetical protein